MMERNKALLEHRVMLFESDELPFPADRITDDEWYDAGWGQIECMIIDGLDDDVVSEMKDVTIDSLLSMASCDQVAFGIVCAGLARDSWYFKRQSEDSIYAKSPEEIEFNKTHHKNLEILWHDVVRAISKLIVENHKFYDNEIVCSFNADGSVADD